MSMIKESTEIIQAFPIAPHTYVGTPSGMDVKGYNILHAAEDCTITFEFGTQGTVSVDVLAGQDLSIHPDCQYLTATGTCWIS